jgi:threonyl-tRNA synthetase
LEEAKKRDHKKLGQELDLFSFHEEAPGFVFWHPKGMLLRQSLMQFHSELHNKAGYQQVSTPLLLSEELWKKSGHWDHYKENMYFTKVDNRTFAIKPMNCPGVILIYKTKPRSWRELPMRLAEAGEVHRHEPSGPLNGLFRVRAFRQDDTHILAREDPIEEEVKNIITLTLAFYRIIGFQDVGTELSTRPEHSIGSDAMWRKAEGTLKKVLEDLKLPYKINKGDGAFYGPKIDFHIKDLLGRSWQCGTIQLDFAMPERFDVTYVDTDGKPKHPVIIHRTVLGSIQRFIGILIEHYAGAFPLWLAPEQIWILPLSDKFVAFAQKIREELLQKDKNLRVTVKEENETLGKKIREGEMQKVPYLLIVGEKEQTQGTLSVRKRGKGDTGQMRLEQFLAKIKQEIEEKSA